jgi:phosphoglycolate phosphatase
MTIKVIVFDFDGTLIASNQLKYDAYFRIFPESPRWSQAIHGVLSEMVEESRYVIIEELLKRLGETANEDLSRRGRELADRYNDIVQDGAKMCPEMENAGAVLDLLKRQYSLYVSSTTPDGPLKKIVSFRGWDGYFKDVFGYPHQKTNTLFEIMGREMVTPRKMVVVGDGESDRTSAEAAGCAFVPVTDDFDLENLSTIITGL